MFFYHQQLALWISDSPLLISAKVLNVAQSLNLTMTWSKDGYVCGIDHETSLKLSEALGSTTLTVAQYVHLALREPRVASSEFAEWLTDTYTMREGKMLDVDGNVVYSDTARLGWFDPSRMDE